MGKPRILIAEDERIVAEDIKSTLEKFGYAISSITSSGEEAVKKAQEERPDLVLVDIVLERELDEQRGKRDPVKPAQPSVSAKRKKVARQRSDGLKPHSFPTLLAEQATRCRNRC